MIAALFERVRLKSRVHALEGLLEIKSELVQRQAQEIQGLHARVRSLELTLEHIQHRLPSLKTRFDLGVLQELEGVLLEARLNS